MSVRKPNRPRQRQDEEPVAAAPVFAEAVRNLDESPLAWLARRKDKDGQPMISDIEFTAGERLRADFHFAQMTPRITANWTQLLSECGARRGSPDHGAELNDRVVAAQERVRRALKAAGPEMAGVLIDVCCYLRGLEAVEQSHRLPRRSGKYILRIALRQLARHYGILCDTGPRAGQSRAVNHWGAEGYRPKVDGDAGE